jgi:hypothetical protein
VSPYQDGVNKGYLLGIVHAIGCDEDTTRTLFSATLKEIPEDEREYWRGRLEEATQKRGQK